MHAVVIREEIRVEKELQIYAKYVNLTRLQAKRVTEMKFFPDFK